MVVANTACGVFMAAVHPIASKAMPLGDYGVFCTLLRIFTLLTIPAAGLQTVFAQQAAAAIDEPRRRELAAATRGVLGGTFALWLLTALGTWAFEAPLIRRFQVSNPAALWMTLAIVLAGLWLPLFQGLLQGSQNFLWLGWSMICSGVGRFGALVVLVLVLNGAAAAGMTAVFLGVMSALAVAAGPTLNVLIGSSGRFHWKPWLKKVVPLTFGVGAVLFVMNSDMLIVQSYFPKEVTAFYAAAAMIGLALVLFTTPLAAVMFPKIVRGLARSEKSNAMELALVSTAGFGAVGAILCTLFPELPLRILYFGKPEFLQSAVLVPWIAWAMVPVTVTNVLVGNLLARGHFNSVPWLVLLAAGYGVVLTAYVSGADRSQHFVVFRHVIQILGCFSSLLLGVAVWFSWRAKAFPTARQASSRT